MSKPIRNLKSAINDQNLTEDEIQAIKRFFAAASRGNKRVRMNNLKSLYLCGNYGIFERVEIGEGNRIRYFAGQDYPSEVLFVRDLILGDKH